MRGNDESENVQLTLTNIVRTVTYLTARASSSRLAVSLLSSIRAENTPTLFICK